MINGHTSFTGLLIGHSIPVSFKGTVPLVRETFFKAKPGDAKLTVEQLQQMLQSGTYSTLMSKLMHYAKVLLVAIVGLSLVLANLPWKGVKFVSFLLRSKQNISLADRVEGLEATEAEDDAANHDYDEDESG